MIYVCFVSILILVSVMCSSFETVSIFLTSVNSWKCLEVKPGGCGACKNNSKFNSCSFASFFPLQPHSFYVILALNARIALYRIPNIPSWWHILHFSSYAKNITLRKSWKCRETNLFNRLLRFQMVRTMFTSSCSLSWRSFGTPSEQHSMLFFY